MSDDKYPDTRARDANAPEHHPASDQISPPNSPNPDMSGRHPSVGSFVPILSHRDALLDGHNLNEMSGESAVAGPSGTQNAPATSAAGGGEIPRTGVGTGTAGDASSNAAPGAAAANTPAAQVNNAVTTATLSSPFRGLPAPVTTGKGTSSRGIFDRLAACWEPTVELGRWVHKKVGQVYCGYTLKFWIIAGAGVVSVFLVGGVPPFVILGPRRQPGPPGVYKKSKVAAWSFKNANNDTVRQVIWQDDSYALMMANKTEGTVTTGWIVSNISESIIKAGHYITVLPGSPLASATPPFVNTTEIDKFWTDIFFLTPANTLNNIWTWNVPEKDADYHPGTLSSYQAIFPSGFANGTSLTAYRDICGSPNCSSSTRLFYQAGNYKVFMANSNTTNWSFWWTVELSRPPGNATANVGSNTGPTVPLTSGGGAGIQNIELGSPLAVTRVAPAKAGEQTEPSDMRLFVDSSNFLQEYIYSGANRSWTKGPNEWFLGQQHSPPDVVATSYALGNGQPLSNVLTAIVFENGTIGQHYWSVSRPDEYKSASPANIQGVTALAIADDRAYCIVRDKIQEYRISWANPSQWTLMGDVPTAVK